MFWFFYLENKIETLLMYTLTTVTLSNIKLFWPKCFTVCAPGTDYNHWDGLSPVFWVPLRGFTALHVTCNLVMDFVWPRILETHTPQRNVLWQSSYAKEIFYIQKCFSISGLKKHPESLSSAKKALRRCNPNVWNLYNTEINCANPYNVTSSLLTGETWSQIHQSPEKYVQQFLWAF